MLNSVPWHRRELDRFRGERDTLFNPSFDLGLPELGLSESHSMPSVDVSETGKEVIVNVAAGYLGLKSIDKIG